MHPTRVWHSLLGAGAALALAAATPAATTLAASEVNHPGTVHPAAVKQAHSARPSGSANLSYHGGTGGVGVETGADRVYIVAWGWTSDPSGELSRQQDFFSQVGASNWNNSVTQYCQGSVAPGATTCPSGSTAATNPAGVYSSANYWADNTDALPGSISQSSLAAEALRAAAHFGNTTAASNTSAQYVIDTPTGHSTSGFGTQFCAWHSSTSASWGGSVAYTNFPYQTDAGASCGANFVNGGTGGLLDGVTIVGGHEFAETETDVYPSSGWTDSRGSENGDKCAWISSGQGAATDVTLTGGGSFPVQSLWSNSFNTGKGGCVVYYASSTNQH